MPIDGLALPDDRTIVCWRYHRPIAQQLTDDAITSSRAWSRPTFCIRCREEQRDR